MQYMYSWYCIPESGVFLLPPRVEKEVRVDSKEAKKFFESQSSTQPAEKMEQEAGLQTGWGYSFIIFWVILDKNW